MRLSNVTGRTLGMAACCLLGLLACGCATQRAPTVVQVEADPALRHGAGELIVHLVGVPADPERVARFRQATADAWFQGDGTLKKDHLALVKELSFGPRGGASATVATDDPIRATWKEQGVGHLAVFVNAPGAAGTRQRVIPLAREQWPGKKAPETITVSIRPGGIYVDPAHLPQP